MHLHASRSLKIYHSLTVQIIGYWVELYFDKLVIWLFILTICFVLLLTKLFIFSIQAMLDAITFKPNRDTVSYHTSETRNCFTGWNDCQVLNIIIRIKIGYERRQSINTVPMKPLTNFFPLHFFNWYVNNNENMMFKSVIYAYIRHFIKLRGSFN
jgi:hypothetical protein